MAALGYSRLTASQKHRAASDSLRLCAGRFYGVEAGCGRATRTGRIAAVDGAKRESWFASAKTAAKSAGVSARERRTAKLSRRTRA